MSATLDFKQTLHNVLENKHGVQSEVSMGSNVFSCPLINLVYEYANDDLDMIDCQNASRFMAFYIKFKWRIHLRLCLQVLVLVMTPLVYFLSGPQTTHLIWVSVSISFYSTVFTASEFVCMCSGSETSEVWIYHQFCQQNVLFFSFLTLATYAAVGASTANPQVPAYVSAILFVLLMLANSVSTSPKAFKIEFPNILWNLQSSYIGQRQDETYDDFVVRRSVVFDTLKKKRYLESPTDYCRHLSALQRFLNVPREEFEQTLLNIAMNHQHRAFVLAFYRRNRGAWMV